MRSTSVVCWRNSRERSSSSSCSSYVWTLCATISSVWSSDKVARSIFRVPVEERSHAVIERKLLSWPLFSASGGGTQGLSESSTEKLALLGSPELNTRTEEVEVTLSVARCLTVNFRDADVLRALKKNRRPLTALRTMYDLCYNYQCTPDDACGVAEMPKSFVEKWLSILHLGDCVRFHLPDNRVHKMSASEYNDFIYKLIQDDAETLLALAQGGEKLSNLLKQRNMCETSSSVSDLEKAADGLDSALPPATTRFEHSFHLAQMACLITRIGCLFKYGLIYYDYDKPLPLIEILQIAENLELLQHTGADDLIKRSEIQLELWGQMTMVFSENGQWRKVTMFKGKPVEFSLKHCLLSVSDPKHFRRLQFKSMSLL